MVYGLADIYLNFITGRLKSVEFDEVGLGGAPRGLQVIEGGDLQLPGRRNQH